MFKELGIKGRLLLLTLLPTCLLAVVLGGYFIWGQLADMQAQLQQRGQLIIEQLAPIAAPALQSGDRVLLQRIAQAALEQADVRSLAFRSPADELLASAGPRMLNPPPAADPRQLTRRSAFDATRLLLPVHDHHRLFSDAHAIDGQQLLGWVELELSHQGTLLQAYRSLLTSLVLIFAGLLLTALLALRLGRTINRPLRLIQQGVSQLKEGHLETRLSPLGGPELDELADGINRMAEALQSAREEMQHSIEQATEDVRQNLETIEIQNIELDLARKEALEASRVKSEFLANMSHEIRTPLNGILGFTHLLQKTPLTPRQHDYLQTIEKSADNLLSIINGVLDFSKIEAGKLVLEHLPFNLRDLVQDCLTMLAPAAHAKQLELVSLIYRDTPRSLIGDPLRLKQILTNLVNNAIKFTHQGSIVVRAMLEDESADRAQLRLSVQDSGIGLTPEELRSLFQAFSQADNSLTRQSGGTGLGLAISKRLIEQMGGEIGVESTPEQGSEFWISISLPKARDDDERLPALLLGRRVAILEPHELACQSLQHQLQDCGLEVQRFTDLDQLQAAVLSQRGARGISLAVLGVSVGAVAPAELGQRLRELERLDCKSLVLCPTTEQGLFMDHLPDAHSQLLAKPACTRRLQQALCELVNPRLASLETRESEEPAAPRPPAAGPRRRVLCVDDNPANLMLVKTLLEEMGLDACAVDSGYAALECTARERFDLIFMDVQMPGMDGRQTTQAIRNREFERQQDPVPIVALTAHALSNEKRSLLQDGMDDYLTKPITEHQLNQVLLKWTGYGLHHPEPAATSEPPGAMDHLAVFDPDEALSLAAGKAELADEMLGMLLASLETDQAVLRRARASEARHELRERVHRLHGAARYCGVPQLRALCHLCETLLKEDHPSTPRALDELDAAISRLLNEARRRPTAAGRQDG